MNIRNKLILVFFISVITPIVLLCIITGNNIKKDSLREFDKSANAELVRIEKTLSLFFDDIKENTAMAAGNSDVEKADKFMTSFLKEKSVKTMTDFDHTAEEQRIIDFFGEINDSHKNYIDVYMGTKFGGFILENKTMEIPAGFDPRLRPWYKKALLYSDKPALTKAYKSGTGEAVIAVSHAVSVKNDILSVKQDMSCLFRMTA